MLFFVVVLLTIFHISVEFLGYLNPFYCTNQSTNILRLAAKKHATLGPIITHLPKRKNSPRLVTLAA
jgi:hypothetical protein